MTWKSLFPESSSKGDNADSWVHVCREAKGSRQVQRGVNRVGGGERFKKE